MSEKGYQDLRPEEDERQERDFQELIWTGSASGKRKREDRDDEPPEHHANKRPRSPSDFSGGVVMSAKPPNTQEEHIHPRLQNSNSSTPPPPPPRPRHQTINVEMQSGGTNPEHHRSSEEECSSSRQTTAVTRTLLYEELSVIINEELSASPELNLLLAPMLIPVPGRQNHQSVEPPRTGGFIPTSAVATEIPAQDYHAPIFTKPKLQHNQEACESEAGDLGYQQLQGQHTYGPTIQNEADVAREPANKPPSPLMPDAQHGDLAHHKEPPDDRENQGIVNIVSNDFRQQNCAFPTKTLQADPSRKRSIEEVENEQLPSSLSKKRRASPKPSWNDSRFGSSSKETPLTGPSKDGSVEGMEDALPGRTPSEERQFRLNTGGNESPASSASTEAPRVATSMKRSIEDVEDTLQGPSTPKRRRSSLGSASTHSLPSSPFNPPERSTPSPLLNSDQTHTENRTIGATPDPRSLNQDAPPHEDPTTATFRPNDTEGLALRSSPQPKATGDGRNLEPTNTDDQSAAHLEDSGATHNSGSETKEHGTDTQVSPDPESQGERHIRTKDDPDGMTMDYANSRDQTTSHMVQDRSPRTEQIAIGVVIPLQIPQSRPATNQELLLDEDTANLPVIRDQRKRGRKLSTRGRKASQSALQRQQEELKPRTRGWKTRQLKSENKQQAYVGRLRSGVGERKHKKPSKFSTSSWLSCSRPNPWAGLVMLEFKGRKAV